MEPTRDTLSLVSQDGHAYPLGPGETSIGRGSDNHVVVAAEPVSRRHVSIQLDGRRCTVVDLGSTNGTALNGHRLQPRRSYPLQPGDILTLAGRVSLTVCQGPAGPPVVSRRPQDAGRKKLYCSSCGGEVPGASAFCLHCGARIGAPAASPRPTMSTNWEYKDFVRTFAHKEAWCRVSQGAGKPGEYSELTARIQFWTDFQRELSLELQKWYDEGWQPITEVGSACFEVRTVSDLRDWSAAFWLFVLVVGFFSGGLIWLMAFLFARSTFVEPTRFVVPMRRPGELGQELE